MEIEQDAFENIQEMLSEIFSVAIARGVGADLVNGNGTTAPQGIVTGGTAGPISAAATLAGDDIESLYFSVDKAYRPGASFLMNDATYLKVRKLKDSSGRPLLSILNDQEMLLGKPLLICPSLVDVSAGAVAPIVFGDMRQLVVKRSPFLVDRVSEAIGFVEYGIALIRASQRVDSKVLVPSAISYLTVHA
jgi:HK97 family phage major capsid protein